MSISSLTLSLAFYWKNALPCKQKSLSPVCPRIWCVVPFRFSRLNISLSYCLCVGLAQSPLYGAKCHQSISLSRSLDCSPCGVPNILNFWNFWHWKILRMYLTPRLAMPIPFSHINQNHFNLSYASKVIGSSSR